MIPYEELCAALERYAVSHRSSEHVHTAETELPAADVPTGEHVMPHAPLGAADDDHTNVGVSPIYDTHSNELDIGDVISDEDVHKS